MAPLSQSNMQSEIDQEVSEIGDGFAKIKLEEQSTYNIDEEDSSDTDASSNLDDCANITEKGHDTSNKTKNNRLKPYDANLANKQQVRYNNNNYIPNQNQLYIVNNDNAPGRQASLFNHLNSDFISNIISSINTPDHYNYAPVAGLNLPLIQSNIAEKALSNYIDQDKKLKQLIWIIVNIDDEHNLIEKLKTKISSLQEYFNLKDLNYIYATIIRLMKEDGKQSLLHYLRSDDGVLLKIALKQNVLLMNFVLEIYHNLGINRNQDILHHVINFGRTDLSDILEVLINYKSDYNFMFDVDWVNTSGETLLMALLKNMAENDRNYQCNLTNMKYLELILSRRPNIINLLNGKNIFHYANEWKCDNYTIEKVKSYYDGLFINSLLMQPDINGFRPYDYIF